MTQEKKSRYTVPYETQWTHIDGGPERPLYFTANTPIREIVLRLQEYIKEIYPDYDPNYTKNVPTFGKLYRNILPNYKGWQVSYRRPNSHEPFGPIIERIGHQTKPKRHLLKPLLQRPMRWTNTLYPNMEPVVLGPVANCAVIARRLNQQIREGCGTPISNGQPIDKPSVQKLSIKHNLQAWLPAEINRLQTISIELERRADEKLDLEQDSTWYAFMNCLQQLYKDCKRLKPKSANILVNNTNINNILYSHTKTAKGWQVEFLDGRASDH